MRARVAALIFAGLVLAGCATQERGITVPLGAPAPRDVLPSLADLPEPFVMQGFGPITSSMGGLVDGHGVTFERYSNATRGYVQLGFVAFRFETTEDAAAGFAALAKDQPGNASVLDLGDEALVVEDEQGAPGEGSGGKQLWCRRGPLVWAANAQLRPPAAEDVDLLPFAQAFVARVDAAS